MSPYQVQPSLYNMSQENKSSPKVLDKRKQEIVPEGINNSEQSELSQGAKNSWSSVHAESILITIMLNNKYDLFR